MAFPHYNQNLLIKEVEIILAKLYPQLKNIHCIVRTDQGGKLGKYNAFGELFQTYYYTHTPTCIDSSKQNGIIENPTKTLNTSHVVSSTLSAYHPYIGATLSTMILS